MFLQMKEELKQQAEAACFKAQPNNVTHQEPFVPKKENRSILGMLLNVAGVFCDLSSVAHPMLCCLLLGLLALCEFCWRALLIPKPTLASFQLSPLLSSTWPQHMVLFVHIWHFLKPILLILQFQRDSSWPQNREQKNVWSLKRSWVRRERCGLAWKRRGQENERSGRRRRLQGCDRNRYVYRVTVYPPRPGTLWIGIK